MNELTLRGVRLIYRNFSGRPLKFNPEGRRNFSVIIENPELANSLIADNWNLKPLNKRDMDEQDAWHLPVAVVYGKYPPVIRVLSQSGGMIYDESMLPNLDFANITNVDLIINPRRYEKDGEIRVKAYLRSMNVTIFEDELEIEFKKALEGEETPF